MGGRLDTDCKSVQDASKCKHTFKTRFLTYTKLCSSCGMQVPHICLRSMASVELTALRIHSYSICKMSSVVNTQRLKSFCVLNTYNRLMYLAVKELTLEFGPPCRLGI